MKQSLRPLPIPKQSKEKSHTQENKYEQIVKNWIQQELGN